MKDDELLMNIYQRLCLSLFISLMLATWQPALLWAEPGIVIRGEPDSTNFPEVKVTVLGSCGNLFVREQGIGRQEIQSLSPFVAVRPTRTAFILDITALDQTHMVEIETSLRQGLQQYLVEIGRQSTISTTNDAMQDQFALFAPTETGVDAQQLITWTNHISDVISLASKHNAVDVPVTRLRNIISTTLKTFPDDFYAKRSVVIFTNGIDLIDYPELSGQATQAVQKITNQLIATAKEQEVEIHLVFYKGKFQNRKLLTEIADRTDGGYFNLGETPQLRQLWKTLYPEREHCNLIYSAKQAPPVALTIEKNDQQGNPISSSLPFTPTWQEARLKPDLTISLPITEIVGSAAISLSGELFVSRFITATEANTTYFTSTVSSVISEEVIVPIEVNWQFPGDLTIPVKSLVVSLSAEYTGSAWGDFTSSPKVIYTRLITELDSVKQSATVTMPVQGLQYGQYHISALLTTIYNTSTSTETAESLLVQSPKPSVVVEKTDSLPTWGYKNFQWSIPAATVTLAIVLWWIVPFLWKRLQKSKRRHELTQSAQSKIAQGFQIVPLPLYPPNALLYRTTLQAGGAQQAIPLPVLKDGVKVGWSNHEAIKGLPSYYDVRFFDDAARGDAYQLTEKNGEFWKEQSDIAGTEGPWRAGKVISGGDELKLNEQMSFRFVPLRRS